MNNKAVSNTPSGVRRTLGIFYALPMLVVLGIFGYLIWSRVTHQGPPVRHISGTPFAAVPMGKLTANLFAQGDQLRASGDDVFIEFRDAQNKLVDVGEVTFDLELKSPDFVMHSIGKVLRTSTPGQYRTSLDPQLAGVWLGTLGYSGPHGKGEATFSTTVAK